MNYDKDWVKSRSIAPFYKDALLWFREIVPVKEPAAGIEVRRQCIWNNAAILVGGKMLFSRRTSQAGINYIDDLLDRNGRFLSHQAISDRYPSLHINSLTYMGWVRAVPIQWKRIVLLTPPLTPEERAAQPTIEIKGKQILLRLVKSSYFYWQLVPDSISTAQKRWVNEGIDFGDRWGKVFALPFSSTMSTKLQSLQYRILHRFLPTRRYLCIRQVVADPFCDLCGAEETIQHSLVDCPEIESFWRDLVAVMKRRLPSLADRTVFTNREILFGIVDGCSISNLLILIAKQFIVSQRYRDGQIMVEAFRPFVAKYFAMEQGKIARKNDKLARFRLRWRGFINGGGEMQF